MATLEAGPKMKVEDRYRDFLRFCRSQIKYRDHDPHIALYAALADKYKLNQEERLWLGLLCMAYYNEGSGWAAFCIPKVRKRKGLPPLDFPLSVPRRNLYGGQVTQHLEWLLKKDNLVSWLDTKHWQKLLDRLGEVYGNGHWSTYTTAEMLVYLGGISHHIMPNTFDIPGAPGPVDGMHLLGLEATEKEAERLRQALIKVGIPVTVEGLESVLCNFSATCKGIFYSGSNIDRQQCRILAIEKITDRSYPELWETRKEVFDNRCLGELYGWSSVTKERKQAYPKTGKILLPYEDRVCRFPRLK